MKKLLILIGIAIVAVSSCAKDFVKETNQGHSIDFKVIETKGQAIEYTSDLDHFYVTAIDATGNNYFTDSGFARSGDDFTSYPEEYYWPADGSNLDFYAYTPRVSGVAITAGSQKIADFTPSANIAEHVDLMTAQATSNGTDSKDGMPLSFKHRLSRIGVRANENNQIYDYYVSAVKLVNFTGTGTFDFSPAESDPNWTLAESKNAVYTLTFDEKKIDGYTYITGTADNNGDRNDAMIIPQEVTPWNPEDADDKGAYMAVKIRIVATESGELIYPASGEDGWVAVPFPTNNNDNDAFNFTEGNRYLFTLDFTAGAGYLEPGTSNVTTTVLGDDIKFTVKINPFEIPDAESETRKALEGEWLAKSVEYYYTDPENPEWKSETYTRTGEDEVKEWFNNNGFYKFRVDNNYNIYVETPSGVESKSSFTVSEDGRYIYLESIDNIVPEVYELDPEAKTCTIYIFEENYYTNQDRHQFIHYDKK